tara:strand:- start:65 stop:463 length:399 start_codon:yes stop_codon:yes gene_type:complete
MKHNFCVTLFIQACIALGLIIVYVLVALSLTKADTTKIGDGPFVLAVSYSQSYDDLQYVANFRDCDTAMTYFHANCSQAPIAMCQLEQYLYMPLNHNTENEFSSFDFEVNNSQTCGFVKTQSGYTTFTENNE